MGEINPRGPLLGHARCPFAGLPHKSQKFTLEEEGEEEDEEGECKRVRDV